MENNSPIIASDMNASFHKLRLILRQGPHTSEELAELMGMDIGNVRILLLSQKEFERFEGLWTWKGYGE